MRNLYLVRHGEVDFADGVRRCIGWTDLPLGDRGRQQAKELQEYFRDIFNQDTKVFASPLKRAWETALILADHRAEVCREEGLKELNMGEWENMPMNRLKQIKTLESEPSEGESRVHGAERIRRTVSEILENTQGDVICVAHAGINSCLLAGLLGTPLETSRSLPQPYGGFSRIEVGAGGILEVKEVGVMPKNAPSTEECRKIWDHYHTPDHIRLHCEAVRREAEKIGDALIKAGRNVDLPLIVSGALLHDVARTKEDHPEAGARILEREGYPEVARIIRKHHDPECPGGRRLPPEEFDKWLEEAVVYLADKRIFQEKTVSVEERFAGSRDKCQRAEDREEAMAAHERRYRQAKEIERIIEQEINIRRRRMKLIRTQEAEGAVLCHDITQIIKGVTKDAVFRKGHIVTKEDIPVLLSVGKDQLYVWEQEEGMLHENDGAEILCELCKGSHMSRSEAKEGKIELTAECDGLLKVDNKGLKAVNEFGEMMIASRHGNFAVKKGDKLAGTRIIPLVIREDKMEGARKAAMEATGGRPILELKPFVHKKVGIVTTGNEVFYGRIQDTFTPVIQEKLREFDTEIIDHVTWNDDDKKVTATILDMIEKGADVVICTGGMSVDPDDKTPLAIKNTGARIVSYGAPVLPGAMFLLAYAKAQGEEGERTVAIMGLPGCVMYAKRTIFDLVLPRVMADDPVSAKELAALGQGGLCLNCPVCTFPNCGFGKGI